ncbi:MAG: hypothetical protein AAFZ15_08845 [Bacteroidota bacterium]
MKRPVRKTYSIFGAGAAGLYTAWRLLTGQQKHKNKGIQIKRGDILELYDWGKYNFSKKASGSREASGRICTYHYEKDPKNSFVELGGMRYSYWKGENNGRATGHRVVTQTIKNIGLEKDSIPFDVASNQLYYLRTKNIYGDDISSTNPVPYNINNYGDADTPDRGFTIIQDLAMSQEKAGKMTRQDWCEFYQNGKIQVDTSENSVFKKGDRLKDIGYWNLMFDQLGSEGYQYTADGNGYSSNVINWNSAEAINSNNEFTPGTEYRTLVKGYSSLFSKLFDEIVKHARKKGVHFKYYPDTRVRSIHAKGRTVHFTTATRKNPNHVHERKTAHYTWLAMPRAALELVAQATKYEQVDGLDVLNHSKVQLYLESAIIQPSYKIGMFFEEEWWKTSKYPAQITGYNITPDVLKALGKAGFPMRYIAKIKRPRKDNPLIYKTITPAENFISMVEAHIGAGLDYKDQQLLLKYAERDTIGPSITDTPIRQVVYFGNNAADKRQKPVYGILASYDDERFDEFWKELELGPNTLKKIPESENTQPLDGPRKAPEVMVKMLRKQLAHLHFGPQADVSSVPEPLETTYMDWSLPPFYAGYHAYAAHYDICDVQQKIRKPSQLHHKADANIFIVGETYSNDQAWVEGAFCVAESVLNDFFGMEPIIDDKHYPFICRKCG